MWRCNKHWSCLQLAAMYRIAPNIRVLNFRGWRSILKKRENWLLYCSYIIIISLSSGSTDDEEGEWGTVSGNKFSMTEAHVSCRQLGFYSASHWNYSIDAGYELSAKFNIQHNQR